MTKKKEPSNIITNCVLTGVVFEAEAVQAIIAIAEGFTENAKGLNTLSRALNANGVNIDALVKFDNGTPKEDAGQ